MNVAFPFSRSDTEAALQWLKHNHQPNHPLFILPAKGVDAAEHIAAAQGHWKSVTVLNDDLQQVSNWDSTAPASDASGPNTMARMFARYFHTHKLGPWFYCEPDCVTLTPDWLDRLETEYIAAGKPFMGVFIPHPVPRLNGTMICPEDAALIPTIALPMRTDDRTREIAFDIACARDVLPKAHRTNLIQNCYHAPPFTSQEDFDARVSKEAVVFHGSKDGSAYQFLHNPPYLDENGEVAILPDVPMTHEQVENAPRYLLKDGALVRVYPEAANGTEPNPAYTTPPLGDSRREVLILRLTKARKALAAKRATGWKPKKRRKKRRAKA